jgi:hypothetical protein
MTKIAPHAQSALNRVREKQLAYKIARENIMSDLMGELEVRLEQFTQERDTAVVLADQAGVPRTQIGRALGTSNYRTVQAILEAANEIVEGETLDESKWSLVKVPEGWQLSITNLGAASVSGSAVVKITDEYELVSVSGDEFVVPQCYRNGIAEDIIRTISRG